MPIPARSETLIDLLRHGEPVGGHRYRGQTDDPLSEKGWEQMRAAIAGRSEWDVIYTSPLRRCAEFARELSETRSLPIMIDPRLMEIGFGTWEGKTAEELRRNDPHCVERFWLDPISNRPESAEPIAEFRARVEAVCSDILDAHPGKRVLVVGHAGITRMMICLALGSPPEHMFRIQVENAGIARLRFRVTGAGVLPLLVSHGHSLAAG